MAKRQPSDYFIDTGGVDLLVAPPDESIAKFWKALGKVQHSICHVVYWEFLRQYDMKRHDQSRQNFLKALKIELITAVPFDRTASDIAVQLFQGVRSRLSGDKTKRRARMNALQCDILIAAVAVRHRKIVVTDDMKDWVMLREIVQNKSVGTLPLVGRDDMRDPKKWRS